MESLSKIKEWVEEGLDQVVKNNHLDKSNLEVVDMLTHTLKSIETIQAMHSGGYSNGYSGRRYSMDDHMYGNSFTGGSNSNNGGGSYGYGYNYSRSDNPLADQLRGMLEQANSERDRRALQDCITKMGG